MCKKFCTLSPFGAGQRDGGIEHHAGPAPGLADHLHRALEVWADFHLDRQQVGPGGGRSPRCSVPGSRSSGTRQGQARGCAGRLDHQRADGDVWKKMPVHDVDVDPVGAGGFDGLEFFAQPGEISGQNGGAISLRRYLPTVANRCF